MLLRGFTTVRDTSGADFALREAIAEGLVPGPRLFIAGTALSQTGGHGCEDPGLRVKATSDGFQVIFDCHTKVTRSSAAEEMLRVLDESATGCPSV
jgi:imidazolonepropionase-like amidohydrolase